MRLILILCFIALTACSNITNNSSVESIVFEYVQELNNLPIPENASEIENRSAIDLKSYEVPEKFEVLNKAYIKKLTDEGWSITEIESNKVMRVMKDNSKYTLIITKKSNDKNLTNVTIRKNVNVK
ncbi:hypothetical protein SAMN04487895_108132 [Paenibacillus sophorae]|uniref:Lipoprotein n=1 Tax=Paenibacillus sophorae TaxID=1333845 RepID=A0A1H8QA81_9BACL|nr:hypothetical protein [Paenibacillus sophorae]SEO50918.1 hypothetical protein SAMN04487895_108132 [Paenibacillus sophorae]